MINNNNDSINFGFKIMCEIVSDEIATSIAGTNRWLFVMESNLLFAYWEIAMQHR
jgi:hypothetical protein